MRMQVLQQSCDSERRLKQAAEQRCEAIMRVELTLACAQVRKLQRMQAQHASALEQASETIMSMIKGFPSSHLTAFPDEISKLPGSFRNSARIICN